MARQHKLVWGLWDNLATPQSKQWERYQASTGRSSTNRESFSACSDIIKGRLMLSEWRKQCWHSSRGQSATLPSGVGVCESGMFGRTPFLARLRRRRLVTWLSEKLRSRANTLLHPRKSPASFLLWIADTPTIQLLSANFICLINQVRRLDWIGETHWRVLFYRCFERRKTYFFISWQHVIFHFFSLNLNITRWTWYSEWTLKY